MKKLLFFIANEQYFYTHRLKLALAASKAGFEVAIITKVKDKQEQIESMGIQVFPLTNFSRSTVMGIGELKVLISVWRIIDNYKPDIIHNVAIKPVIYGSILGIITKTPKIINALGGLGYLFTDSNHISQLAKFKKYCQKQITCLLLKLLSRHKKVYFLLQNKNDIATLQQKNCLVTARTSLIRGAGVDLNTYTVKPLDMVATPKIIFVARMLWDKGVKELIEAITILRSKNYQFEALFLGLPDSANPASVPESKLKNWHKEGLINWLGYVDDVADVYSSGHIAVLPSYREGLPKALLEAAACARPIVTTDVPGCREIVQDNVNGLLVPHKDPIALAKAIETMLTKKSMWQQMGEQGRKMVAEHFSDSIIHRDTIALYRV